MSRKRVAVLISGRGSNMAALAEAAKAESYPAEICLVIADNPDAAGLAFARNAKIAALTVNRKAFSSKNEFECAIDNELRAARIELICLAGFMRILSADFVNKWPNRILNIHPSLLPTFKGLDTHQRALDAGVKIAGCTVHFVSAELDAGPIIAQGAVPVQAGDTAETLAARILPVEHELYPLALRRVIGGEDEPDAPKTTSLLISPAD